MEIGYHGITGHEGIHTIFNRVARYRTLTPLTNDPSEWGDVTAYGDPKVPMWQSRRDPTFFSNDGGKTGYSVDDKERKIHTFRSLSSPPAQETK